MAEVKNGRAAYKRSILCLDMAYTLKMVRERQLEQEFASRDCGGYFEHVWGVHPITDIPENRTLEYDGFKPKVVEFSPNQITIEGSSAYYAFLKFLYPLNFIVSQIRFTIFLIALVKREKITHILSTDPNFCGLIGVFIRKFTKAKLVIWVVANYDMIYKNTGAVTMPKLFRKRWVEKMVERWVFRNADLVAGGNQDNLEYSLENGAKLAKSTVFPVGKLIHPEHLLEADKRRPDTLFHPEPGIRYFIYIGRMIDIKYPDDVIRSFELIYQAHPNTELLMAGEGAMRPFLEKLAADSGIKDRVNFLGNISQQRLAAILPKCFAVLSPLTGRSLIECTLASIPVVAYDLDWQPEYLGRNGAGIIVPSRNWKKMAESAIYLLDHPEVARDMGAKGRISALEVSDTKKLFEHEQFEFEKLMDGGLQQRKHSEKKSLQNGQSERL